MGREYGPGLAWKRPEPRTFGCWEGEIKGLSSAGAAQIFTVQMKAVGVVLSTPQVLELSAEECQTCREELKGLLRNIYQPVVFQQLLLLQNGPGKVSRHLT